MNDWIYTQEKQLVNIATGGVIYVKSPKPPSYYDDSNAPLDVFRVVLEGPLIDENCAAYMYPIFSGTERDCHVWLQYYTAKLQANHFALLAEVAAEEVE